jgi:general stress protein 26
MAIRYRWFLVLIPFCVTTHLRCQTKSDTTKQATLLAAREIMEASKMCALITQDKKGTPQVRTMDPFAPEADFTIWLATNPKSRKVDQIRRNKRVTLYYTGKADMGYVVIHGMAQLIHGQSEKDKYWKEEWKDFYKNHSDQYLLIKVKPMYLEVINYDRGILGNRETWQPSRIDFK